MYYLERVYYPTWTRLDGLLAGVLLAAMQLFRPRWWHAILQKPHQLLAAALVLIALACMFFADRYDHATGLSALGTLIGFPVLALGLACLLVSSLHPRSPLALRIPGIRTLAMLSFSLYLTHKALFHLTQIAFPSFCDHHRLLALPVYALAALLGGGTLYLAVERPFLKLRDHLTDQRSLATEPVG